MYVIYWKLAYGYRYIDCKSFSLCSSARGSESIWMVPNTFDDEGNSIL